MKCAYRLLYRVYKSVYKLSIHSSILDCVRKIILKLYSCTCRMASLKCNSDYPNPPDMPPIFLLTLLQFKNILK